MYITKKRSCRTDSVVILLTTLALIAFQVRTANSQTPPPAGLYFMRNGLFLLPGDSVHISDIGPQPAERSNPGSALVCVTTNVNKACCRSKDNNGSNNATAGAVGEWLYPNGTLVPRPSEDTMVDIVRIGYTHQVRLARGKANSPPPLGVYTCQVPDPSTGDLHYASITVHENDTSTGAISTAATMAMSTVAMSTMAMSTDASATMGTDTTIAVPIMTSFTNPATELSTTADGVGQSPSSTPIIIAVVVVLLIIFGAAAIIIVIFIVLRMKRKKKYSDRKTEPVYYNDKRDLGTEAVYTSPQGDDYYSSVDKGHTSNGTAEDGQDAYAVVDEIHNSNKQEFHQVYDDVENSMKNGSTRPNGAASEANNVAQMYAVVDVSAKKKGKKQGKAKASNAPPESQDVSEMYAIVDKNAKKKNQQEDRVADQYAVVDIAAKKKNRDQSNEVSEYAAVDNGANNIDTAEEQDLSPVYSVVDKSKKPSNNSSENS